MLRRDLVRAYEKGRKEISQRRPVQDVAVMVSEEHIEGGTWVNVVVKGDTLPPDFLTSGGAPLRNG